MSIVFSPMMSLIVMYILKCLDIIRKLIINQTGGRYLLILSGKDLYKQTIVVSAGTHDTFPASFPNIFVDYPLGQMRFRDRTWTNWNKATMRLWQTQLNFAVWCASSACGVSSAHLNYTKHPMIRSGLSFSRLLSREASSEKITGSSATRDRF